MATADGGETGARFSHSTIRGGHLRRAVALLAAAGLSLLGGCSLSPYRAKVGEVSALAKYCGTGSGMTVDTHATTDVQVTRRVVTVSVETDGSYAGSGPTLPDAIRAAAALEQHYHQLADRERNTRHVAVGAGIPLGAVALFQGALSTGSARSIAALGLGGAGAFALAQNYTAAPRELVYLAGAKSLNCVREAFAPFESPLATTDLQTYIDAQQTAINTLVDTLSQAQARKNDSDEARRLLNYALEVENHAKDTLIDALRLSHEMRELGTQFCIAIKEIGINVAVEARKADPDPAAVLASIKLLPQLQTAISSRALPTPPPVTTTSKLKKDDRGRIEAFERLDGSDDLQQELMDAISAAARSSAMLATRVAALAKPANSISSAGNCAAPQLQMSLTVTPDVSALSLVEEARHRFTIRSPVGFPSFSIDGGSPGAVTGVLLVEAGQTLLELTAQKVTGTPAMLTIRDGTGALSKSISITVTAKPAAANPAPAAKKARIDECAPRPGDDATLVKDAARIKLLQVKLNLAAELQTGCADGQTRENLKAYQRLNRLAPDGLLTMPLFDQITR